MVLKMPCLAQNLSFAPTSEHSVPKSYLFSCSTNPVVGTIHENTTRTYCFFFPAAFNKTT